MTKILTSVLVLGALLFCNCTSAEDKPDVKQEDKIQQTPFKEGTISMGIFSNDIELGKLIEKVDFLTGDVKKQYENLLKNDPEVKTIFQVIQANAKQNPLVGFAMTSNISQSTYYIKDQEVLADVKGFGWNMNHYHNVLQDKGSMYFKTLVNTPHIAKEDTSIFVEYKPSSNQGANAVNTLDLSEFNREPQREKQTILGYQCNVVVYKPKVIDSSLPMQLYKIVVYTSDLFSPVINFTHPFYLQEKGGILALDIYYQDSNTPTLVMKPKEIKPHAVAKENLVSKTATPSYNYDDLNWAFKSFAIMTSGWRELE
ncbi:hypothetical protein [Myroides sp. LJL119]